MVYSDEVQIEVARAGGRAELLAEDPRPDVEKVDELFLWAFARKPNEDQRSKALEHISKNVANKKLAYENILWALLNTKEFIFNR